MVFINPSARQSIIVGSAKNGCQKILSATPIRIIQNTSALIV